MNPTAKAFSRVAGPLMAASAAALLTSYATTRYLINAAFDRREPLIMKGAEARYYRKRMGDADYVRARTAAGKRLEAREHEIVRITAHDGIPLVGHWFPGVQAKRVVIAVHGWRSTWYKPFGLKADFLADNDCSVLYVEQRGQNESGGDYMGFGLTERFDCLDWAKWVVAECGTEIPIYLFGVSMGAATVMMSAGLELPKNVSGIIADCGYTSPNAIWRHVSINNLHLLYGIRGQIAAEICKQKIHFGPEDYSTLDALENTTIPILFIHGSDDRFVPIEMTYENYKACASQKRLLVVPGADHGMSYYIDRDSYEKAVKDFWAECESNEEVRP